MISMGSESIKLTGSNKKLLNVYKQKKKVKKWRRMKR